MGGARESKVKVGPDAWRPVQWIEREENPTKTRTQKAGSRSGRIHFVPPERWNGRAHAELEALPTG